jgi:hypothetical protein
MALGNGLTASRTRSITTSMSNGRLPVRGASTTLGNQSESHSVLRSDYREMASIQRSYCDGAKPLGQGDNRGINGPQTEVSVTPDELSDAQPITWRDRFGAEGAARKVTQKPNLRLGAQTGAKKIGDFGDYELGNDHRSWMRLEQLETGGVVSIVRVDICV